jgi:tRNA modification GTPase
MDTPFDTIAAVATPPGVGGISIVRISGPKTLEIADTIFRGRARPSETASHTVHYGSIVDPKTGELMDEVLLTVFRAPKSYTAEDMVEISCHGSSLIADGIVRIILNQDARLATPGEFTRRAVLNHRIDVIQAEAILDLIEARTDLARQAALRQLGGNLSENLNRLTEELKNQVSRVEALLEFPEDEIFEPESVLDTRIRALAAELEALVARGEASKYIRDGASVVIIGKPNVGKSSIFNRLLDEERAIVTEIPGTTRDSIEVLVNLGGIPVRLYDTCGLRPTDNTIEVLAAAKTKLYREQADLVLAVFDNAEPITNDDLEILAASKNRSRLLVLNKIDLPAHLDKGIFNGETPVLVSAKYGTGFDTLSRRLEHSFASSDVPAITNRRHIEALRRTAVALMRGVESPYPEIRSFELKTALAALGEITGVTTPEEILDRIFSQFCIGK